MAGKMALIITRFTRFGANLGTLHVTDARHVEDLDGTDELTVTCSEDLAKGDYLVWRDQQGNWREHIVDVPERWRDEDGTVYTTALCINSIAETWDDWVDEVRPNGSAQVAMERVLASSRWSAGTCTQTGTAHRTFYHKSVRESLQGIVETWGGELVTTITSDGTKVTGRSAAIVAARGNQSSAKRFTYTKDLLSIHRRVNSDNPKTRIYAYGRGEELDESGAYGRRIGIADVNGGIPYVEDTAATAIWGRYDASGNLMPAIGVFIDEECEDPATLKEEAIAYLQRVKEPSVTYEADVIDLAAFGREWEEVALGDTVTIVDKRFSDEGLRLHGRISRLERDLLDNDTTVTFGTLTDVLAGSWAGMREHVGYLTERTAGVENVVNPSASWLDQLISSLNSQYNAAGTYHYSSFEQGEIWSSVPLDENGHATQSGGWAININGMGFRLASSLNADGSWNWRTFGTGEGFTADEIVAGVIRGGQSYWNLNTGDFVISSSSTIGGHAPDDFLTDVDVSVEQTSTGANITVNGDTVTLTNGQDGATGPQGPQGPQGIQGEKGADGTSVTVTSIQYGTSSSASTQPSSWSTTAPTSITKGRWLWVKTNYSNNTSAITKSYIGTDGDDGTSVFVQSATKSGDTTTVVIKDSDGNTTTLTIKDGEDGTNGTNGTDGRDGTNGANAYVHTAWANSADGTTDFSTTVSAGKLYLGVYTDNTAADSTSPSAYSWTKIKGEQGEKGEKGDAGTSVTVTKIEYGTSTSASTQPSSWSTSAPSSLTKGSWLWVKTTYSNGDSAITKSYVGTDGENGKGATELVPEYYLSTSSTGLVGGSWSAEQQEWQQGHYYWTRQKVTWTDGTTSYTDPVLESALNSANNCALSQHSSGTVINGSGCTIRSLAIHGKSQQDGTPSPSSPVEIQSVEGGNLFDPSAPRQTVQGCTYSVDGDSITITATTTNAWPYVRWKVPLDGTSATLTVQSMTAGGQAYLQLLDASGTVLATSAAITTAGGCVTLDRTGAVSAYVVLYARRTAAGSVGDTATLSNVMLQDGVVVHRFAPYGAIPIFVSGKNLLNTSITEAIYASVTYTQGNSGEIVLNGTKYGGSYAIVKQNAFSLQAGTYTFSAELVSGTATATPTIYLLGNNDAVVFQVTPNAGSKKSHTVTLAEDTNIIKLRFGLFTDNSVYTNATYALQLELGSEATEYEPYTDASAYIPLQGHALRSLPDGTDDVLEVDGEGNVTLTQRIGLTTTATTDGITATVGTDAMSTTGTLADGATVIYKLATPQTISLGKIDLPSLPSPSFSLHVDAAVSPVLDAEWWTVDGIASTDQLSQVASDAAERIGGLEDAVSAINNAGYATRAELEAAAAQLMPKDNDLFKWLRIVDSTLQIGRETTDGNRFYSSYTADGLGFYAGDSTLPVTALTRELGLYAPRSTIDEQLKIGGWAFIKRSNGNLTLKYIGG